MTNPAGRFVIIATPRCGSNWLCTLLDSHPAILCHHELFNADGVHIAWSLRDTEFDLGGLEFQRKNPLALLERAWNQTMGYDLVGFKLNIDQPEAIFSAVINDPTVRKVLLSRRNRVRAYLSECIAEASGQWESFPESSRPQRPAAVRLDPEALKSHARRNAAYLEDIRARLAELGQSVLELQYEELGLVQTHRDLLTFLCADTSVPMQGRTRRMNPEPLSELVSNLEELAAALAGDDLAKDLLDEPAQV